MKIEQREIKLVDLGRQYADIEDEINEAIFKVVRSTDFILGQEVSRFEEELAAYCEAKYAVGVDSGTSALELALRALGIGPGDEVLAPVNTFMATASAVSFTGARPVLIDMDPVTYNMDVGQMERAITPRTKAILPVHLYGQPAEMDAIMEVANRHGLLVLEDACQAHGARYKGRRVGAIGHAGAFSFYPGKNLGAYGDGGAVVTNDAAIAENIRIMRNVGQREKYNHVTLAWNRRLDTLHAAVLRVKLRYLDRWNERRRDHAALYSLLLAGQDVVTPQANAHSDHVYHLYVIQAADRDGLLQALKARGVGAAIHYPIPIHLQPAYNDLAYGLGSFPVAEAAAPRILSLPMFAELSESDVEFVVDCISTFMKGGR